MLTFRQECSSKLQIQKNSTALESSEVGNHTAMSN